MKIADLRNKSVTELENNLVLKRKEQFKQRMQLATAEFSQVHLLKTLKKDIARLKTILKEKTDERPC